MNCPTSIVVKSGGSYLSPLFGQHDKAVVVDQVTAQILNRKKQKRVSLGSSNTEDDFWWWATNKKQLLCTYSTVTAERTHTFNVWTLEEGKEEESVEILENLVWMLLFMESNKTT